MNGLPPSPLPVGTVPNEHRLWKYTLLHLYTSLRTHWRALVLSAARPARLRRNATAVPDGLRMGMPAVQDRVFANCDQVRVCCPWGR